MTGNELRQQVCNIINGWIGGTMGSSIHQQILSIYNNYKPLAVGYVVKATDAYCATTVSAAWIKAGIAAYTGTECSVPRFITVAKNKGIWTESDSYVPKIGDAVCYDWGDGANFASYDNTAEPDHIGIVTKASGNAFIVTEGNMSGGKVGTRSMQVNGRYIRGYITPDYDAIAAKISGSASATTSQAATVTTNSTAKILGVDVSEHNGTIDWAKVKSGGIQFAIIRTGYGKGYTDPQFHANMKGALAQGIPVGIYHFSYALDVAGAKKEAEFVISLLKQYKDQIKLPVFFDFEYDTIRYAKEQGVTLGKEAFNDHTVAFCEAIKAAGYTPGTYFNLSYLNKYVDKSRLGGYVQWYAQYNSTADWTGYDLWQYSSDYYISGISHRFDINIMTNAFWNKLFGSGSVVSTTTAGWKKNSVGWWYEYADGSYPVSKWVEIDGSWYYFNDEGYMLADTEVEYDGKKYVFDSDGHVAVTEITPEIEDSAEQEKEGTAVRYEKLSDVASYYRPTLDKLIEKGYLKGRGGTGEDLILDMSEDAVRLLVILDRTGVFD